MTQAIDYDGIAKMLRAAAAKVRASHARLSELDSLIGDGDHGTTMVRAVGLMEKTLDGCKSADLAGLLADVGWAFMGVDGGATGPLLGTLMIGMSEGAAGRSELDAAALAAALESGLAAVKKHTPAQVGDKTMIDALEPAVRAVRAAAGAGEGVCAALAKGADAAEAGAAATARLRAKFGRARNLGDRSIGPPDPGATSISLIFRAFADAVREI